MRLLDLFRGYNKMDISSLNTMFYNFKVQKAYNLFNNTYDGKLRIPNTIVDTIVNSAVNEFEFNVQSKDSEINRIVNFIRKNVTMAENHLCIGGEVAFKPYIKDGRVAVNIVGRENMQCFYNDFGELSEVYIKSDIRESEFKSYTLVERHYYENSTRTHKIEYYLFDSSNSDFNRKNGTMLNNIGKQVPLHSCKETEDLDEIIIIEDVDHNLCSVVSLDNDANYAHGKSIYETSFELIEECEKLFRYYCWEYEGGKLAIQASKDLFIPNGKNKKLELPVKELYQLLPGRTIDDKPIFNVFNPQLRDESYQRGINQVLHNIENNCGLYFGALSNGNIETEKTASEILASRAKFYSLVMKIKYSMQTGIDEIINNCVLLQNRLKPEFAKEDITVEWNIGDSVLEPISTNNDTQASNE